ncbi:YuzB family protein [Halobacillus locisalis]|uniref:YuzB family protein n=1 Tax=Halobacillus locisalis TaxID=220753 RepID=A0A838CXP9_9BACI|nr:YuzB family protein [Halobacillus locisalis]MBA2176609.1 YuzB family protein [Halobacillus locisalis]
MGVVVVEICDGNLITELDIERIIESEYPDVAVLMNECLSFCGMCAVRPYAIVNGTRVFGKTSEEALEKIRTKIEEELALFAE